MNVPKQLRSGDSSTWNELSTNDPQAGVISSADWALKISFRGNGASLDLTGVADGAGGWDFTLTTANSADLAAGVTYWQAYATKTGQKITIGSGQLKVLPNLVDEGETFDGRSQAKKDLEAVQVAMRAMISGGAVQEYTIGNRSVRKMTMADLIALENQLKREVVKEESAEMIANGLGNPRNLFVRF